MITAIKTEELEIEFREPTVGDVLALADDMRVEDQAELLRSMRKAPREALDFCIETSSTPPYVIMVNGKPLAIYGMVKWSTTTGRGSPWVLTTNQVYNHRKLFMRLSRVVLGIMRQHCPNGMEVMIDAEYTTAIKWVQRLGFVVDGPHPWGISGTPFMRAAIGRL